MAPNSISLITTLLLVFISAIAGAIIAKKLKQPALVGYIGMGVVLGNIFSSFLNHEFLTTIAESGVTLLLFTLGVEFSFHRLRKIMGTVLWAAAAQILLCAFVFLLLFLSLGFGFLPSFFIAIAASLSSTAVVIRVLSERGELETLPGEILTGWLIIQDLAVIPIMLLLPALVSLESSASVTLPSAMRTIVFQLLEAGIVLNVVILLGRIGIPKLLNAIAKIGSREVFLLTTIGIVFLAAVLTFALGLSPAIGAFVAGLLVAETSQNHAIFAEVRPLRDLFAVVFFVSLGMALPVGAIAGQAISLIGIAGLIVVVKWFLVFGLTRFLGYHRKTAFIVGIGLAQMSEFGFIIATEGQALGALSHDQYIFLVALAFLTILIDAPILSASHTVYYRFYGSLGKWLPKFSQSRESDIPKDEDLPISDHIVICGYGRVGKYIGRALEMAKIPFLVVDYNQTTVTKLRERGVQVVYGDPADKDVLDYAQVDFAKAIIIAIPDRHTQELIIGHAQTLNKRIKIICRSHHEEDQRHLKSLGVHTVIQPEFEAALSIIERVLPEFGVSSDDLAGKVTRLKIEHGLG